MDLGMQLFMHAVTNHIFFMRFKLLKEFHLYFIADQLVSQLEKNRIFLLNVLSQKIAVFNCVKFKCFQVSILNCLTHFCD